MHKGLSNRIEGSHQSTRKREKIIGPNKSLWQAQRFLVAHDQITISSRLPAINLLQLYTTMPDQMPSSFGSVMPAKCPPDDIGADVLQSGSSKLAIPAEFLGLGYSVLVPFIRHSRFAL